MTAPNDEARRAREAEHKKEARALSGHALITGPEAAAMCGITTKHIRTLEAQGDFPARVRIGPNRVAWRLRDLEEWIDASSPAPPHLRGQPARALGCWQ
ncbi:putative DNA-binding transcriptional regulator AlpA [Roseovarius sp. MBR-78]|jgi:predicted DNA-binding transcriptional regulator AlpA|uniref:helix-turn-helix transcriptional regulator n=1 Tax=Roseovarius sp. MBR-78 TaxID=3156460 RepID=UPI00339200B1